MNDIIITSLCATIISLREENELLKRTINYSPESLNKWEEILELIRNKDSSLKIGDSISVRAHEIIENYLNTQIK